MESGCLKKKVFDVLNLRKKGSAEGLIRLGFFQF